MVYRNRDVVVVVVSAVVVVVIVILTSSVITIVFVDPNLARSSTRADSAWALSTWCSASLSSGASTCTLVLPRKFLAVSNEYVAPRNFIAESNE